VDQRAAVFVEVMAAIAAVAVVAFVIFLIAGYARRGREGGAEGHDSARAARWFQVLLAVALVVAVVGLFVWQLWFGAQPEPAAADWRAGDRSLIFFVIMAALGALALLAFLIFLVARARPAPKPAAASPDAAAAEPGVETPSATRLLGLLLLGLAFLLLNWIALSPEAQYGLMLRLVYPAALAVALVLLFDKATRAWSVKGAAETVREWLLCDGLVFLLILGFLNLAGAAAGESYGAMFWDFLFVALFFVTFWLLDRKLTRYRFLVAYGYLILAPILLLIWRLFQEWAAPVGLSWWGTIWPFFFLAVIFFVLEIIALVATREADRHLVPAIKDAVFVALYGVLLIVAVPGTDA
jgi:hypothetical protein